MGFDTNATISNQLTIFACPPYPAKIFIRDIVIASFVQLPIFTVSIYRFLAYHSPCVFTFVI